jgi:hypothetical protein
MISTARTLAAVLLLTSVVAAGGAEAQTTVRHGGSSFYRGLLRVPRQPPISRVNSGHTYFGTVTRFTKTSFVMRLRNGRLVNVDASPAIAAGRYSTPFFAGKVVVVIGTIDRVALFHAQSVTRLSRLDISTDIDR